MKTRVLIHETDILEPNEGYGAPKCGKQKLSNVEIELEQKLKTSESKLVPSQKINSQLLENLSKIKEELNHSIKWTDSSKIFTNLESQQFNTRKGLGCRHIETPYNLHKNMCLSQTTLCIPTATKMVI